MSGASPKLPDDAAMLSRVDELRALDAELDRSLPVQELLELERRRAQAENDLARRAEARWPPELIREQREHLDMMMRREFHMFMALSPANRDLLARVNRWIGRFMFGDKSPARESMAPSTKPEGQAP